MYLTKYLLNPGNKEVRRDIADPYEMHSTLCRLFADPKNNRFLWRLEKTRPEEPIVLLLQSHEKPELENFSIKDYFYKIYKSIAYNPERLFEKSPTLIYRLKANPTVKRNGKRVGLKSVEEQLLWLKKQGDKAGFEVHTARVMGEELLEMKQRKQDNKQIKEFIGKDSDSNQNQDILENNKITLNTVYFEGYLVVNDPQLFIEKAIKPGLGKARAFGLGMLSIAPV